MTVAIYIKKDEDAVALIALLARKVTAHLLSRGSGSCIEYSRRSTMNNTRNRGAALLITIMALTASTFVKADALTDKANNYNKALSELKTIGVTPGEYSCEANTKKEMYWRAYAPGELFRKILDICEANGPVTSVPYELSEVVACNYYPPAGFSK